MLNLFTSQGRAIQWLNLKGIEQQSMPWYLGVRWCCVKIMKNAFGNFELADILKQLLITIQILRLQLLNNLSISSIHSHQYQSKISFRTRWLVVKLCQAKGDTATVYEYLRL